MVLRVEPARVHEDPEGRAVRVVVAQEVAAEEVQRALDVPGGGTAVGHGARVAVHAVPSLYRDLPQPRVLFRGAGAVLAVVVVRHVVEREGPDGLAALPHRPGEHGRVVGELAVVQRLVHVVAAQLQEGNSEPADRVVRNASVGRQRLFHSHNLVVVLLVGRGAPPRVGESVGQGVAGDLDPHGVQRVHEVVVGAGPRHEQSTSHWAAVGVVAAGAEEALEVAVVGGGHLVVERQHDHLGRAGWREAVGDVGAGAVTVGELAVLGVAF